MYRAMFAVVRGVQGRLYIRAGERVKSRYVIHIKTRLLPAEITGRGFALFVASSMKREVTSAPSQFCTVDRERAITTAFAPSFSLSRHSAETAGGMRTEDF